MSAIQNQNSGVGEISHSGFRISDLRFAPLRTLRLFCATAVVSFASDGTRAEPELADPVFKAPLDPKTKNASFEAVAKRLQSIEILRCRFRQTKKIRALRRPLVSTGDFVFARSTGICWRVKKPFEALYVIKPAKILLFDEDGKQTEVDAREQSVVHGFTTVFLSLFKGDVATLQKHFSLFYTAGEDGEKWSIGLLGHGQLREHFAHHVVLKGSATPPGRGGGILEELRIVESTGDQTIIRFSAARTGGGLTAEERDAFGR